MELSAIWTKHSFAISPPCSRSGSIKGTAQASHTREMAKAPRCHGASTPLVLDVDGERRWNRIPEPHALQALKFVQCAEVDPQQVRLIALKAFNL